MVLRKGAKGADVKRLQEKLSLAGFNVPVTGEFDARTHDAVVAFQSARGLATDGLVGDKTWSALETPPAKFFTCGNLRVTLETVRRMCPDAPASNLEKFVPEILFQLEKRALNGEEMVRVALATVYTETRSFVPLSEFQSKYNTSPGGRPFDLYDDRRDLGNQGSPDGERFRGRGFIQLTGRTNYLTYGQTLKVDLIHHPELANTPSIAAAVLAEYLKKREGKFLNAVRDRDLAQARKLVNGGSHGLDVFTASFNGWAKAA